MAERPVERAPVVATVAAMPVEDPATDGEAVARPRRALITQLKLAGESHGDGEGLRIVDLDVEDEGRLDTGGEYLHLLSFRRRSGSGKKSLKAILVVDDGARALARHEFT